MYPGTERAGTLSDPSAAGAGAPGSGGRHFGVGGMRERALLAGGDLSVESAPGEGCVISAWVPTEVVPRDASVPEPGAPEPGAPAPPAEGSDSVPARSVPGYTWQ